MSAANSLALFLALLVVLALVIVAAQLSWVIPLYNRLVVLRQNANRAFADMDVLLKQRRDLIPNIVETVKGYASHENATLRDVVSLRSVAAGSGNINEKVAAENSLSSALGRVFALAEAYPDLKANTSFLSQQNILSDIEVRISNTRMKYNAVISEYNSEIQRFPAVLVAGSLGFHSREFFDIGAEARSELNKSKAVEGLNSKPNGLTQHPRAFERPSHGTAADGELCLAVVCEGCARAWVKLSPGAPGADHPSGCFGSNPVDPIVCFQADLQGPLLAHSGPAPNPSPTPRRYTRIAARRDYGDSVQIGRHSRLLRRRGFDRKTDIRSLLPRCGRRRRRA